MLKNSRLILKGMLLLLAAMLVPVSVCGRTLERIQDTGVFTIGYVLDQAPFSFKSTGNAAEGYSVELGRKVADMLKTKPGLADVTVNFISTGLEEGLKMVAEGRIDLLCGAVSDTLKRRESVSFSLPVYITGTAALVREDASPDLIRVLKGGQAYSGPIWRGNIDRVLSRRTFAVTEGTTTEAWLRDKARTLHVIATIATVSDHENGVEMVADKKADAYFADRVLLENYASGSKQCEDLMIIDHYFSYEPIALVTPHNDDDFRLAVDTALSRMYGSGEILQIYQRYFGEPADVTQLLFKLTARH